MSHQPIISLEALIVLDAIDERGSYAAAAEKLNKVPSALSYIVQKLEEQLAVTIFQRQGRRSVLTPAGKHLLAEGRHILLAMNKLSEQTQTIANGWEPKLRIAIDSIIDVSLILPTIKAFLQAYPTIEIDLSEEVLNGAWESLIDDSVDLLIGASEPVPVQKGIHVLPLTNVEMVFCVSSDHPLATITASLEEATFKQYSTVIVHDSAKAVVQLSTGVFEQSNHIYVPTLDYKIKAILAGLGGGFLPKKRVENDLATGRLIQLHMKNKRPPITLYMAWKIVNKGKGLEKLKATFSAINFDKFI